MSTSTFAEESEDELEEVAEESEDGESEEDIERHAALYKDFSTDARTIVLLLEMKKYFNGKGGEISSLTYRGRRLADQHRQDGEFIIAKELKDLVTVVAFGRDASEKCWKTVDTLMSLPH
jgi:oligoendopeptidase F